MQAEATLRCFPQETVKRRTGGMDDRPERLGLYFRCLTEQQIEDPGSP